ncbi:Tyrosine-protein kinase [Aphelenchoides fujianensis]|nr:Tyrosine-protein kinase [Aphelenchoides fujianensis]
MGDPNWKLGGEEKPPAGNSNDAPEEEDVGYQRRIKIRLPPGTKEDDDPFLDPASLLPINDSFGQVIVPLNPDGLPLGPVPPPEATGEAADEHVAQPAAPTHPTDSETTTTPQTHSTSPSTIPDGLPPPPPSASPGTTPVRQGLPLLPLSTMGGTGTTVVQREMCLSVKWADHVQHFLLQPSAAGLFALNEDPKQAFPGVLELVNFHLRTGTPFGPAGVVLINPICRQDWEFRQDQIRLLRPIGSGAFGQVFHGTVQPRGAAAPIEVAVKTLKCSVLNKEKIEEIMKETRMMRLLRHRNVVSSPRSHPITLIFLQVRCYGGKL